VRSVSHPVYRQELFRDGYVCLWRQGHPFGTGPIDVEQFASARHLAMPRQTGARERVLQDVLQRLGIFRDVALQVPHMLAIPATLAETDLIATVARRTAVAFAENYSLAISPHPLPLGRFSVSQLWHARTQVSQAQRWLRDVIASASQTL
jgi:DNA-binding transcriptional LysR family regulator